MARRKPPLQTQASSDQARSRKEILALFKQTPIPIDQLMTNLHLYTRSSVLAKILYVDELYRRISGIPGIIMEFGVWWGANLALFESLRAVHEPYNYTRKVVGFDTFAGYPASSNRDGKVPFLAKGGYSVGGDYEGHLRRVLDAHEKENTMGHIKKYELVKGDAKKTVKAYLKKNPHTVVALAYFDMGLYEPTKAALEAIRPHLARGSVIAMDQLNSDEMPGETIALRETLGLDRFKIERSRYLPDRSILVIE